MIKYTVSFDHANQHLINVKLTINQKLNAKQQFWLPDWIPGSYMIRDFSKNITQISAQTKQSKIPLTKISKSTWQINQEVEQLEINYQVYAWDLSVRSAHLDNQHCFFNGTSVFLAIKNKEDNQCSVILNKPNLSFCANWKVATSMLSTDINEQGFGEYQCENYSELIDHPFEMANFIETVFIVDQIEHRMVFTEAPKNIDLKRIAKDVQTICQYECSFFNDNYPPFKNYLFMTFVQKNGYGGLEHMSSTALHCSHEDLPKIGDDISKKSESYQRFLALCSHEYFHCWNVKRIKPLRFKQYQLQQEVNTELLWFFEGITSYYDELFLVRSGVINVENYLDMLAKNITRYLRAGGRKKQTVTDSSFDAWTKFYKQDENSVNSIVSYYVKGGLVALCLDFKIREQTEGKNDLDDLLRQIWQSYGKIQKGVDEKDIQIMTETLVGENMDSFFNHLLYSTDELDLTSVFKKLNINFQVLAESKSLDKGGYASKIIERADVNSLNITHKTHSMGAEIINVFDHGCASEAGLSNKDIIIAIDGYRINSKELDQLLTGLPLETEIEVSYFRRDKLYHCAVKLTPSVANTCYLNLKTENHNDLFNDWIGIKT